MQSVSQDGVGVPKLACLFNSKRAVALASIGGRVTRSTQRGNRIPAAAALEDVR